jgi:hypothetical protein
MKMATTSSPKEEIHVESKLCCYGDRSFMFEILF